MAFNIERVPNQAGKPAVLLRQAWREGARIRKKTIANLSKLPPEVVEGFRAVLKGGVAVSHVSELFRIERSLDHGNVVAALGTARRLGFERLLDRKASRTRQLALAAIIARVLAPDSRLATSRRLSPETATTSLGALLGLGPVTGNEMLATLDWLLKRQRHIERSLANRHLKDGALILYDVSSSYLEGKQCPLAAFGHNRDGKKGKKQIVYGLLCAADGCPVAVEVFAGNTSDPATLASQVKKVRTRFGISRVALVGDRGMITTARIHADLKPVGLDWISALKSVSLRRLAKASGGAEPSLDPEALVPDAVAEIDSPDFPDERLMVCLNPRLREERCRKREDLMRATERTLQRIDALVQDGTLSGEAEIGRRVGREANRHKVEKLFEITIGENSLSWRRRQRKIEDEARFDGIYVIRTSLSETAMRPEAAVEAYKSLASVERAFRVAKSELRIRPVHACTEDHVRGHVFLCMLACHLEWQMRKRLAPLLFEDDDRAAARGMRTTPVGKSGTSASARGKTATRKTSEGFPAHGFRTLLDDLSGVVMNTARLPGANEAKLCIVTQPTRLQRRAFELLEVSPDINVPISVTV